MVDMGGSTMNIRTQRDLHDQKQFIHVQRLQAEVVILIFAFVVR